MAVGGVALSGCCVCINNIRTWQRFVVGIAYRQTGIDTCIIHFHSVIEGHGQWKGREEVQKSKVCAGPLFDSAEREMLAHGPLKRSEVVSSDRKQAHNNQKRDQASEEGPGRRERAE
jgi:hypothetical protein